MAAPYRLKSERAPEKALEWIDKAILIREKAVWWDYRIKCLALLALEQSEVCMSFAEKGYELAKAHGSEYGILGLKGIMERCK